MILTIPERELANYLRRRGLTYKEICYLKWRDFNFDGDKISVPRKFLGFRYKKNIDLKEDNEIYHIAKTLEGKRRCMHVSYFVFYDQFPVTRCKREDPKRYGSPFTPEKMEEMIRGYSVESEERPLLGVKLVRV